MTLIELLDAYRCMVDGKGREAGLQFLKATCDKSLHQHIIDSVSDHGSFIDGFGNLYMPYGPTPQTHHQ